MSMNALLLTGGTGFFGCALLRHWNALHGRGHTVPEVLVLSRKPEVFLSRYPEFRGASWLAFHAGDILNKASLPYVQQFKYVLHGATDSTLGPSLRPLERYRQIVEGTQNILDLAVATGASRFLLTSSGGVYGPQPAEMDRIPEDYCGMPDPMKAANAYSVAKRAAEHLCTLYQDAHGIECVVARCFAFAGQDLPLDAHFAIGNFIRDALFSDEIVVSGDGMAIRSYMDQRDLANWLEAFLFKAAGGQAFNVGSDQAISIRDLAHLVRDVLSPKKSVRIMGKSDQTNFRSRYVPDIGKARTEMGLDLAFSLKESIEATAQGRTREPAK